MQWSAVVNGAVLSGRGRAITAMSGERVLAGRLLKAAQDAYARSSHIRRMMDEQTFIAAYSAALARRDYIITVPQSFHSAGMVLKLFSSGNPEKTAIWLYNSIMASTLAFDEKSHPQPNRTIESAILVAKRNGLFLRYPQDIAALGSEKLRQTLPGAVRFLLNHHTPVLSTWAREARLERDYQETVA